MRKQGQRLLERGALDPLHEDERVVLARSIAIDARKSAQVRDGAQMTVLLEQGGGVGQVRSRLLGGAIGGLAGKDGVVLEQLDGKDLAACVGRAQHVSNIAAVAVCRLKNKRHKPALGIILGAGVDCHGGIERVETDEFVARGGVGGIQDVPSFGGAACSRRERDYRLKPMIDVFADKLTRIAIYSAYSAARNVNDIRRVTPVSHVSTR